MSSRYLNAEQIKKECYKFRPVPAHRPDLYILEQPPVSNLLRPLKEQISIARTHDVSSMLNILEQSGIKNAKEMYALALKNPIPSNPIPIPSNLNRIPIGIQVSPQQSRPIDYLDLAILKDKIITAEQFFSSSSGSSSTPSLLTESETPAEQEIEDVEMGETSASLKTALALIDEDEQQQELKERFNKLEVEMGDRPSPLDLRKVQGGNRASGIRKSESLRRREEEPYIEFRPDLEELDY